MNKAWSWGAVSVILIAVQCVLETAKTTLATQVHADKSLYENSLTEKHSRAHVQPSDEICDLIWHQR